MNPERHELCHYHAGTLRNLKRRFPHMTRDERIAYAESFATSCCTYWLGRGIPAGWWV